MKEITYILSEIEVVAKSVIANCNTKTLLFDAPMGYGKTTLIKALAFELGVKETLQSPTFGIINEYEFEKGKLNHFDLYRINDETELLNLGIEEYLFSEDYNFIEWPQKMKPFLPSEYTTIKLTKIDDTTRTIKIIEVKK